jgi:hypothetical protein
LNAEPLRSPRKRQDKRKCMPKGWWGEAPERLQRLSKAPELSRFVTGKAEKLPSRGAACGQLHSERCFTIFPGEAKCGIQGNTITPARRGLRAKTPSDRSSRHFQKKASRPFGSLAPPNWSSHQRFTDGTVPLPAKVHPSSGMKVGGERVCLLSSHKVLNKDFSSRNAPKTGLAEEQKIAWHSGCLIGSRGSDEAKPETH